MEKKRVLIIGGGAAGMMAALAAADAGAQVVLLEKNEKLGKKIYITGKGRCNVTNACDRDEFFAHLVTNPRFLYSSFDAFGNWDMTAFLEQEGLALKTERGNRVFPVSDKASDVTAALQRGMERRHVRWLLHTKVASLWLEEAEEKQEPRLAGGSVFHQSDRPGSGPRPRQGHHPPGHQAPEHHGPAGRQREGG